MKLHAGVEENEEQPTRKEEVEPPERKPIFPATIPDLGVGIPDPPTKRRTFDRW